MRKWSTAEKIGAASAGAALVLVGAITAVELSKKPSGTPAPSGNPTQMLAGNRYSISETGMATPVDKTTAQAVLDGILPGALSVASATSTGTTATVIVDVLKTVPVSPLLVAVPNGSVSITLIGPSPMGGGKGGGTGGQVIWVWTDAQMTTPITAGTKVRISITPAAMAQFAFTYQLSMTNARALLATLIGMPQWFNAVASKGFGYAPVIYNPGDPLPADWPKDEPSLSGNFHIELLANPKGPFLVQQLPVLMRVWTLVKTIKIHL